MSSTPKDGTYLHEGSARGLSSMSQAAKDQVPGEAFSFEALCASVDPQQEVLDWSSNLNNDDAWLKGPRDKTWFTGPPRPATMSSLPYPDLTNFSRADMREYFDNSWAITEELFAALQTEEPFYRPPYHDLRHPLIFYYGHPACFYVNKLRLAGLLDGPVNPYFESIFEVGVDEMRWDDINKSHKEWPSVRSVHEYRKQVYEVVCDVIENAPGFEKLATDLQDSPWWSLPMGFEHERIHIETSSVLMRELPIHLVRQPEGWPAMALTQENWEKPVEGKHFPSNPMLELPEGTATLGKSRSEVTYGWDNEFGSKSIKVPNFKASQMQISNGEFYEFVVDGGYRDSSLWSETGWGWACFRNVRAPTFWVLDGPNGLNKYKLRTVFSEEEMQWDWPAIVNYHEAKAYCAWRTRKDGNSAHPYRVLTEAEHWRLRGDEIQSVDPVMDPANVNNTNLKSGAERAVNASTPNSLGFHDVMGNAWEWCEDHQAPLPGFEIHHLYDDFTLPCFDAEHNMIMGGSFVSTGDQSSIYGRYQFRPHFFQHASFRMSQPLAAPWLYTSCMESPGPYASGQSPYRIPADHRVAPAALTGADSAPASGTKQTQADYELESWTAPYLHLHFPPSQSTPAWVPDSAMDFPARCAQKVIETASIVGAGRGAALDLGCAVGGASFELATRKGGYESVVGVDFSDAFINLAKQMQQDGQIQYHLTLEGDQHEELKAMVPTHVDRNRLSFMQGDATDLSQPWAQAQYDAVLMGNLLCRLPQPHAVLQGMAQLVAPKGVLMLTSPFSWKPEFTAREEWLGGREAGLRGSEAVAEALDAAGFDALDQHDMPLVIRHHARFYELIGASASIWQRRN